VEKFLREALFANAFYEVSVVEIRLHLRAPKLPYRRKAVMARTEVPAILKRGRSALSKRQDVIKLESEARGAASFRFGINVLTLISRSRAYGLFYGGREVPAI
jgi:hypothetical protein